MCAELCHVALAISMKNASSHCGRFQFQCHSGDCIAVYNACDGIPQCDDGSDEGPEVSDMNQQFIFFFHMKIEKYVVNRLSD